MRLLFIHHFAFGATSREVSGRRAHRVDEGGSGEAERERKLNKQLVIFVFIVCLLHNSSYAGCVRCQAAFQDDDEEEKEKEELDMIEEGRNTAGFYLL